MRLQGIKKPPGRGESVFFCFFGMRGEVEAQGLADGALLGRTGVEPGQQIGVGAVIQANANESSVFLAPVGGGF